MQMKQTFSAEQLSFMVLVLFLFFVFGFARQSAVQHTVKISYHILSCCKNMRAAGPWYDLLSLRLFTFYNKCNNKNGG